MTKDAMIQHLLRQSRFLSFRAEDLKTAEQRYRSKKFVHVRFAYQWRDERGKSRDGLSISLKNTLRRIHQETVTGFPASQHKLSYASLRAQAGTPLLHKIVLDVLSADILFFDVTFPNPNVFFELGIAYTANQNIFLLVQKGAHKTIASDIAGLAYCEYESAKNFGMDSFAEKDIKNTMKRILKRKTSA